ncbi:MAG: carbohydrate ABC transporter substrate-binding protein [Chloroflexi bacterium]|nr:carbohydrate ABC transporter substrate-binding protein [Chloroflexota bacterium]
MQRKSRNKIVALATALAVVGQPAVQWAATTPVLAQDEIVITCTGCEASATDIFVNESHRLAEAFNAAYAGRYRIEYVPFAGVNDQTQFQPYLKRLAANDQLPDLFVTAGYVIRDLGKSGRLVDWTPELEADPAWSDSFFEDAWMSLRDEAGSTWGIPRYRNSIGIFYNTDLFSKAGIDGFPTTWDELLTAAAKLKESGVIPMAQDSAWISQLWWSNLIGVQPGGPEFLAGGILEGGFAEDPIVVTATERLKQLFTDGYVNPDAFSGDFFAADTLFTTEKAAILANGPWEIPCCINGETANPGLYDRVGYSIAPDSGVIAVSGEGSFASGARTDATREAVTAFMKFMTTKEQALAGYQAVGGGWPFRFEMTPEDEALIDPVTLAFMQAAAEADSAYVHALQVTPAGFLDAFQNNWPAYVQGAMSTQEFLAALSDAATAGS